MDVRLPRKTECLARGKLKREKVSGYSTPSLNRHIRGTWARKCCQILVQEPVEPQIIDSGIATSGLVAHTLVSRYVDHLPYYRQEAINARSGLHTPRSTLAAWSGRGGAALQPLLDVHREFVLGSQVLHANETPVEMLDPGAGKTKGPMCGLKPGAGSMPALAWLMTSVSGGVNAWDASTASLKDGAVPVDNKHVENLVRPGAMGRKAWLFAGSELARQRAAVVMSMVQSATLNGHDPWAYLKDVLERLPTHLNNRTEELLPHGWTAAAQVT